jgi:enoyl-CoA hydratase/carnithine racemase
MANLELSRPRPDIALLTLNRPDRLNALNHALVEDLHATLDGIRADDQCRVVILTGAGRGFCSGLDLTEPSPNAGGLEFPRSGMRWQERIAELTTKLSGLRQPVIAPSLDAALQVENRSQLLASTSGELREAATAFATRKD